MRRSGTNQIKAMATALLGYSWAAGTLLVAVALIWFVPDRRIEKTLGS